VSDRGPSRAAALVHRALAAVAAALALAIAAGTVFALAGGARPASRTAADPRAVASGLPPPPAAASGRTGENAAYFTGIGKIRAASGGKRPATVVVSVAFPYDRGDAAFAEELASKTSAFRELTRDFFESLSAEELRGKPESELKEALAARYNAALRLGKIGTLYFNDYLVID